MSKVSQGIIATSTPAVKVRSTKMEGQDLGTSPTVNAR